MSTLSTLNHGPDILTCKQDFLTKISQYSAANTYRFSSTPLISGMPQGSVLGPHNFFIHIDDLPHDVSSSRRAFNDYCVIHRILNNISDFTYLQDDLDATNRVALPDS